MAGVGAANETPRSPDPARIEADKWAKRAAFGMLVAGAILILLPAAFHLREAFGDPFKPRQSTTVDQKISGASGDRAKVVTTIVRGPGPRAVTTTQTTRPGTRTTETTTTEDADQSFFERSLAAGGLVLFRLGLLAAAAFLAGAVVQRVLLARFAIKLGPVEVPELDKTADATQIAINEVKESFAKQIQELANELADGLAEQAEATQRAAALATSATRALADIRPGGGAENPP